MVMEFSDYNEVTLGYNVTMCFDNITTVSSHRAIHWPRCNQVWLQLFSDHGYGVTAAKSFQSCLTLYNPTDGSPPGSPVPGILQARTLEWAAISFSNAWKWKVKVKMLSRVWLFATPRTVAYQASLSIGFSRQEYWTGLLFPFPGDLLDPGIKSIPLVSPALTGRFFTIVLPGKALSI